METERAILKRENSRLRDLKPGLFQFQKLSFFAGRGASGTCTALALVLVGGTMTAEMIVTERLWVGATIWVEVPTKTKLLPCGLG